MTDPNYTALLLVIDRSGSMKSIRDDMIGGLTTLLQKQAVEPGLTTVDVVIFDDEIETTAVLADPATLQIALQPRGSTALLDAIGLAVSGFGARLAAIPEHARPGTVVVVVATDGLENASREWTSAAVQQLLTQQREQYGWDFVFLGANQDAITTGQSLGFAPGSSIDFAASPSGVHEVTDSASRYLSSRRAGQAAAFTDEERRRADRG